MAWIRNFEQGKKYIKLAYDCVGLAQMAWEGHLYILQPIFDDVPALLDTGWYEGLAPNVRSTIGMYDVGGYTDLDYLYRPDSPIERSYSGDYDFANYGNSVNSAIDWLTGRAHVGKTGGGRPLKKETLLSHTTLNGDLIVGDFDDPLYGPTAWNVNFMSELCGFWHKTPRFSKMVVSNGPSSELLFAPSTGGISGNRLGRLMSQMLSIMEGQRSGGWYRTSSSGRKWENWGTNFKVTRSPNGWYKITYHLKNRMFFDATKYGEVDWDIEIKFGGVWTNPEPTIVAQSGTYNLLELSGKSKFDYNATCTKWYNSGYNYPSWDNTQASLLGTTVNRNSFSLGPYYYTPTLNQVEDAIGEVRKWFSVRRPYANHTIRGKMKNDHIRSFFVDHRGSFTNAAFYSTMDAVKKFIEVIDTNHIEALSELSELGRLLPKVAPIVKLISQLHSGKFDGVATKLTDLLSDFHLWYQFGLRPNQGLISELGSKSDNVKDRLHDSGSLGLQTLHGKFIYEFPTGTFGYDKSIMIVRSKVVCRFDDSSLLTAMLGGKAVGLYPGFSEIWESLSLSFIADWFTNMDSRLEAVDYQGILLALSTKYCVHTFNIFVDMDVEEMEEYGIWPVSSEVPQVELFWRDVSFRAPSLRAGRFDYLESTARPDLFTAGSLIWSLSKKFRP